MGCQIRHIGPSQPSGLQATDVHDRPVSQVCTPVDLHEPLLHLSPVVHALPSLQLAVLSVYLQPPGATHESFVHGLLSLQVTGVPVHVPLEHESPDVHAL